MDRLEDALNDSDLEEAKRTVLEAKKTFGENSMVYQELNQYLNLNSWEEE